MIASLPWTRRPQGSGPRAMKKVASSAKKVAMRSGSRALNASLICCMSSIVGPAAVAVVTGVSSLLE